MCRAKSHCSGGRRCDDNKPGLRSARRRNAKLLDEVSHLVDPIEESSDEEFNAFLGVTFGVEYDDQNQYMNLDLNEQKDILESELVDDLPVRILDRYKDNSDAKLEALILAQEREELQGIEMGDMTFLGRENDEEYARLVSLKRRLKIEEIRESLSGIRDREDFEEEELNRLCRIVEASGALVSAEGAYSSGMYPTEIKKEIDRIVEKRKDMIERMAVLKGEAYENLNRFKDCVDSGEVSSEFLESDDITPVQALNIMREHYPGHELTQAWEEINQETYETMRSVRKLDLECFDKSEELNSACLDVIKSTREFGLGENGKLRYHPMSDPRALELVEGATHDFPKQWWDRGNTGKLLFGMSLGRAYQISKTRVPIGKSVFFSADEAVRDMAEGRDLSKRPDEKDLFDPKNSTAIREFSPYSTEHTAVLGKMIESQGEAAGDYYRNKPIWAKVSVNAKEYIFAPGEDASSLDTKGWERTPETTIEGKKGVYLYKSLQGIEMDVSEDVAMVTLTGEAGTKEGEESSVHELSHHFESKFPAIRALEQTFYNQRTEGESLSVYSQSKKRTELVRKDDFVDVYMGKDYSVDNNGEPYEDNEKYGHFELLSTGLESFKGHRFGGLLGFSSQYRKGDQGMRNFILGLLSSI